MFYGWGNARGSIALANSGEAFVPAVGPFARADLANFGGTAKSVVARVYLSNDYERSGVHRRNGRFYAYPPVFDLTVELSGDRKIRRKKKPLENSNLKPVKHSTPVPVKNEKK